MYTFFTAVKEEEDKRKLCIYTEKDERKMLSAYQSFKPMAKGEKMHEENKGFRRT